MVHVLLLTFSFCAVFIAGCSSHRTCQGPDWVISVGSGGGITGGSSGYELDCEGTVRSWRTVQAGSATEYTPLFELDCDSADFYWTYLSLIKFDTINYSRAGNWTYFVEERRGGEYLHRVSWTGDDGPVHVRNFYDLFTGFVTSRAKK